MSAQAQASYGAAAIIRQLTSVVACGLLAASCSVSSSFNAAIELTGQVEDEDGTPLDGVRLSINESRVSLMEESFLSSDDRELVLPTGRFQVACRECSGVRLHFSREGYYSETLDFHVESVTQPDNRMASDVAQDLRRRDLRIVLRSAKNAAKLDRYRGFLATATTGPVTVVPLRRDLGTRGVPPERLARASDGDAQVSPGHVILRAAVTDNGELAEHPYPERPGARLRVPASPVIDFGPAGGGVILDQQTTLNKRAVYRSMRTAPLDGYQQTFSVPTADRTGAFYFYCRIGTLYGKGVINLPSFNHVDGQEVVQAHIEIRLNPDGSRNVETAR